jgi:tetratricopeptide (TPR) repeat protein
MRGLTVRKGGAMRKICFGVILVLTTVVQCNQLETREIRIDDTLTVELVNNRMSDVDAKQLFDYAKSSFYDQKKYRKAENAFKVILEYSQSELRDDSLYYIGNIYYHHDGNTEYVKNFRKIYSSFPDGNVIGSGLLSKTLLGILESINVEENFNEFIQIYHFLKKADPANSDQATQIVKKIISESFVSPEKDEGFSVPCSFTHEEKYRIKYLAFDNGWDYSIWQIANDLNNNGDLTREWKEGEINKIRESTYQRVLKESVEQFEYITKISLSSETRDKVLRFIEKNSRLEHSVVTKDIKRNGRVVACIVINCCIFYEISLDTISKVANIDLLGIGKPVTQDYI